MRPEPPRIIYLVHESPGRVRFRASWLRDRRHEATPIADALSELGGVDEVQVRPFTGSVLVTYDPARLDVTAIRRALCAATGVSEVTLPGHETPEQIRQILRGSVDKGAELSQAAAKAFQELNIDVLRATGGHISLGGIASLSLWLGAAAKVLASGRIELPEWHQLLWWGFRSFSELEVEAIASAHEDALRELGGDGHDVAAGAPAHK